MSKITSIKDFISNDKISAIDALLFDYLQENQVDGFQANHFVLLALGNSDASDCKMIYGFNPDDELGIIQFKGYLDEVKNAATEALHGIDFDDE